MAEKTTAKQEKTSEVREHMRAAHEEMRQGVESLFPREFVEHRRQARKEMLLAWRSMLDSAIQRMDEK
jgi:hypothetical protein